MVICKTPIAAFGPKSGHTFCYIRKQITINFYRDIPTFHRPSVGTLIVTFLGISLLFCHPSIDTQIVTLLGISHLFRYPSVGTQVATHFGISQRFRYSSIGIQIVTLLGISLLFHHHSIVIQIVTPLGISQHFHPQPLGTLFVTSYHFAKRTKGTQIVTYNLSNIKDLLFYSKSTFQFSAKLFIEIPQKSSSK